MSNEIKLYTHPEYDTNQKFYKTAHDLYEGNQDVLKRGEYLFYHELEKKPQGKLIREVREQRSAYTNFIEPVVSMWVSYFFKKKPTLGDKTLEMLGDGFDNIDGEGTSLYAFIQKKLLPYGLLYGFPILRINAVGEKPDTIADENSPQKFLPYFQTIDPINFVDWDIEKKDPKRLNKLNFCRIEFLEMAQRVNAQSPVSQQVVSIEYRLEKGIVVYYKYVLEQSSTDPSEKKWKLVSTIPLSSWDEIPIVLDVCGESWVKDLLPHALKYYNLESTLDNICLYQAYQRVIVIGPVGKEHMDGLAEYTWSSLPEGTTIEVVEPNEATGVQSRLSEVLNNIFRIALNQTRMLSSDSKAVQSSETIKEEKEAIYNLIQSEAEAMENIVNQGLVMYAKFKGVDDLKPDFKFNLDTSESSTEQMVRIVTLFRAEIEKLPALKKELLSKAVRALSLDDNKDIEKEIETYVNTPPATPEVQVKDRLLNGFNNA